jgi:uncharacterized protein
MNIDWVNFTPGPALIGGLLIGVAAAAFALLLGRVAGISGIVGGLLRVERGDVAWRLAFVAGLLLAPTAYALLSPIPEIVVEADYPLLVAAGLLVGIGTRYGAGCTAGHGVCGIPRRSRRSFAATAAFMAAGFAVVYLTRHVFPI